MSNNPGVPNDATTVTSEYESDPNEEEFESDEVSLKLKHTADEDETRAQDLIKLNKYLNSLAYNVKAKPLAKKRCELGARLAQSKIRHIVDLKNEYRDVLQPKERSKRRKHIADTEKFISTEELEQMIKKKTLDQESKEKAKKRRGKVFFSVLDKLEQQCRDSAMRDIVNKFANYLADRCVKKSLPSIMTESFKNLTRGLICNMYLSLGIQGTQSACNIDQSIYETLAFVLADLILEANFQLQSSCGKTFQLPIQEKPNEVLESLKKRALIATKKKTRYYKTKLGEDFERFMNLTNNKESYPCCNTNNNKT